MIKRRTTSTVTVGNVKIGSAHPVSIQSMTTTVTSDIPATIEQVRQLEKAGCDIVRVAIKDAEDAKAITEIKKEIKIPVVADIHFLHRLAIDAMKAGADKIRINPGNIQKPSDIDDIITTAFENNVPIRVGVNSGSLMEEARGSASPARAMVETLMKYLHIFTKRNFENIVISLKSSDVAVVIDAYRLAAKECDYPFHVGVTAAGSYANGIVKSSVGIGTLLMEGIGDTIRVSLTGDPVTEVEAGKNILTSCGLKRKGIEVIACPTCGRCQTDVIHMVNELEEAIKATDHKKGKPLVVAVMGCEVNGPGEAMAADLGIAFGAGKGAIFRKGKIVKTVDASQAVKVLTDMIKIETDLGGA